MPRPSLPELRPDQKRIADELAKHDTVCLSMGRRWGKTVLGLVLLVTFASYGGNVAWVVPAFKNGRALWRMLKRVLGYLSASEMVSIRETERMIEFSPAIGGGLIAMYSADDNADSIRSEAFHLVVLDEAARMSEEAWVDSIQPTLADSGGKALLISTPRGRNWFWREWMRGQDESDTAIWSTSAPSSDNPNPRIKAAFAKARDKVSERTFRQEWLAEFVDDAGGVFHGVRSCLGGDLESVPRDGIRRYVMGVDLAKINDYTVCCVIDERERQVVAFERFNQESWPLQKERIARLAKHWNNAMVWLDSTGVGSPIYDDLSRAGLHIHPVHFTNASKQEVIEHAVLLVEQQKVRWPAVLVTLTNELEAYEYERTPAGLIRMNAPGGLHDDCVIAFSLACMGVTEARDNSVLWQSLAALKKPASGINGQRMFTKVL